MSIFLVGTLIGLFGLVISLILGFAVIKWQDNLIYVVAVSSMIFIVSGLALIAQTIDLRKESIRQTAEREQILYQVENLTDDKDKVKLNEWILSYNDWVNDINAEKLTWGWFAWHDPFDMSNHTIIDLV